MTIRNRDRKCTSTGNVFAIPITGRCTETRRTRTGTGAPPLAVGDRTSVVGRQNKEWHYTSRQRDRLIQIHVLNRVERLDPRVHESLELLSAFGSGPTCHATALQREAGAFGGRRPSPGVPPAAAGSRGTFGPSRCRNRPIVGVVARGPHRPRSRQALSVHQSSRSSVIGLLRPKHLRLGGMATAQCGHVRHVSKTSANMSAFRRTCHPPLGFSEKMRLTNHKRLR